MENDMIEKVVKEINPEKEDFKDASTDSGKKLIETINIESKTKKTKSNKD